MALSGTEKIESRGEGDPVAFAVKPGVTIFPGAIGGIEPATGLARPYVAGDRPCGIAREKVSGGSGGAVAEFYTTGEFLLPSLDPLSGAEGGVQVWPTDDQYFTQDGVDSPFAAISRVHSIERAWVRLLPFGVMS